MVLKRVIAYFIDIMLVVLAASMLASISYLNPQLKSYGRVYDEYLKVYEEHKTNKDKNTEAEEEKYNSKMAELNYELDKNNIYGTVISIVLIISYFAIFQKYNGGQTLGKKIMKIRVENNLSLPKYLLRTIILNNTWINALRAILVATVSKKTYISASEVLTIAALLVESAIIVMVVTRDDNRGLHDLIVGSKVNLLPEIKKGDN